MRFFSSLLLTAAVGLLPLLASAQVVTDAARATVARDSVLQASTHYQQLIEQASQRFEMRTPHLGKRRRVVRGYALVTQVGGHQFAAPRRMLAWKHVTRTYRTGAVREDYTGYLNGRLVLEEHRTNQQPDYIRLYYLPKPGDTSSARPRRGELTREGYVHWGRDLFVLPKPARG